MKIFKNAKEAKTTIIGLVLALGTVVYGIVPYLKSDLWEVSGTYVVGGIVVGLLLVLAPDRILDIAFGWIKKKSE